MSFLAPLWLALLLVPLVLFLAYLVAQRRRVRYAVRFTELHLLSTVAPRRPGWWRHLPAAALLLALGGLAVATARPVAAVQVPRERATIVVAVDTSGSMQAEDVAPDRLSAAQLAATDFVSRLPERFNVSLVSFDDASRVLVPPTTRHDDVITALRALRAGGGTAIGDAVLTGLEEIRSVPDGEPAAGETQTETREVPPAHLVLLSDGTNTSGAPVSAAAQAARDAGVPVSTIAYGTAGGSIGTGRGSAATPVDTRSLQELATTTGGRAYTASDGEQLDAVYADIGSDLGSVTEEREIWRWFAGAGLVLVAVAGAVSLLTTPRLP